MGLTSARLSVIITTVVYADVAHLVERHLAKVEVASSSLVVRSIVCPDRFCQGIFVWLFMVITEKQGYQIGIFKYAVLWYNNLTD